MLLKNLSGIIKMI